MRMGDLLTQLIKRYELLETQRILFLKEILIIRIISFSMKTDLREENQYISITRRPQCFFVQLQISPSLRS